MISHINIIGYNPSVSTTASPVWSGGATAYVQLTTGAALEVVSSSANDAAAGTGARTVRVDGVDGSYVPFSEIITMNGVTPVPLVNTSAIAINKTVILTAGSGLVNAGNIDVRAVSGSAVKSRIQALAESSGRSADFIYTIPASMYALVKRIQVYARSSTGDIWVYLKTYTSTGVNYVSCVGQAALDNTGFSNGKILIDLGTGLHVSQKTLLQLIVDVSAGTPVVSAVGEIELYAS